MKEKLKEIRKQNKKTQQDIAEMLNVSRTTYSNYEQGVAEPDIKTIIKLANFFHTTTDNLLGHKVPYLIDKSSLTPIQQELFADIKQLSDANCKRVQDFITGILVAEENKQNIINRYKNNTSYDEF